MLMPDPDSDLEPYITAHPMRPEQIRIDHLVHVPVWERGQVIGWDTARVLSIQNASGRDPYYIVRLNAPDATYDEQAVGYYGYSIECGICAGSTDVPCPQCRPPSPATPANPANPATATNPATASDRTNESSASSTGPAH
jgi:hypothetical protein